MLLTLSVILFIGFLVVGGLDGIYFHIHRFRLWAHEDSWLEHVLHTWRAVLLPPMLWALFFGGRQGLWIAIGLVGLDLVATVLDVWSEPKSRVRFGGLPRAEFAAHIGATVLHVGALSAAFAAKFSGVSSPTDTMMTTVLGAMIAGTSLAAVHHVALAVWGAKSWLNASHGQCCGVSFRS